MPAAKVNTATLIRGDVYTLRHPKSTAKDPKDSLRFKYGEPVVIEDRDVLQQLEDLTVETQDGDGEIFDKPVFRIDRGVNAPDSHEPKRTRLSADRKVRKKPIRRAS